jgi:thiamine monophosphate synthase
VGQFENLRAAAGSHRQTSRPADMNQLAKAIVNIATGGGEADALPRGREGGLRGGKARAKNLTSEQRREIASKAALARWKRGVAKNRVDSIVNSRYDTGICSEWDSVSLGSEDAPP